MRDISPLSARFDLAYVRRRHYPDTWTRAAALVVVVAVGAIVGAREWLGDEAMFSSGDVTHAHAVFAHDCAQCHQPAPAAPVGAGLLTKTSGAYWLPVRDDACLRCHSAPRHNARQSMFTGASVVVPGHAATVVMSGDCKACHVEHRGRDANLNEVPDRVCIGCHADMNREGRAQPTAVAPPAPPAESERKP